MKEKQSTKVTPAEALGRAGFPVTGWVDDVVGPWQSSSFLSNKEVKVSAPPPPGLPQCPTLISDSRCVGRGDVLG